MQLLWVIAAAWNLAGAAPEDGYSYPLPANSYSFGGYNFPPSGKWETSGRYLPSNTVSSQSPGGYFYPAATPRPQYGVPDNAPGGGIASSGGGGGDLITTTLAPLLGGKDSTIDGGLGRTDTPLGGGISGGGGFPTTEAPLIINKHVYFYAARDPPTTLLPPTSATEPPPRRVHYKIIFIKAPSYQTQAAQVVQSQLRDEHKTLIYVLVKKPEEAAAPTLPTAPPTAPSKPEVYFIRYKARAQVEHGGSSDTSYGVPGRTGGPY